MDEPIFRNLKCYFLGAPSLYGPQQMALQESVNLPFDANLVALQLASSCIPVLSSIVGAWIIANQTTPIILLSAASNVLASQSINKLAGATAGRTSDSVFNQWNCRPYFVPAFTPISLYAAAVSGATDAVFATASLQFQKA